MANNIGRQIEFLRCIDKNKISIRDGVLVQSENIHKTILTGFNLINFMGWRIIENYFSARPHCYEEIPGVLGLGFGDDYDGWEGDNGRKYSW